MNPGAGTPDLAARLRQPTRGESAASTGTGGGGSGGEAANPPTGAPDLVGGGGGSPRQGMKAGRRAWSTASMPSGTGKEQTGREGGSRVEVGAEERRGSARGGGGRRKRKWEIGRAHV